MCLPCFCLFCEQAQRVCHAVQTLSVYTGTTIENALRAALAAPQYSESKHPHTLRALCGGVAGPVYIHTYICGSSRELADSIAAQRITEAGPTT